MLLEANQSEPAGEQASNACAAHRIVQRFVGWLIPDCRLAYVYWLPGWHAVEWLAYVYGMLAGPMAGTGLIIAVDL